VDSRCQRGARRRTQQQNQQQEQTQTQKQQDQGQQQAALWSASSAASEKARRRKDGSQKVQVAVERFSDVYDVEDAPSADHATRSQLLPPLSLASLAPLLSGTPLDSEV
jgi:hypothetical protein